MLSFITFYYRKEAQSGYIQLHKLILEIVWIPIVFCSHFFVMNHLILYVSMCVSKYELYDKLMMKIILTWRGKCLQTAFHPFLSRVLHLKQNVVLVLECIFTNAIVRNLTNLQKPSRGMLLKVLFAQNVHVKFMFLNVFSATFLWHLYQ